jgi:intracellular septation protein
MKLLFDLFPVLLFFISYKFFGLYYATAIAMVAAVMQVVVFRLKYQRYERMHILSLILILTLGGATLIFHDPWFIKWKPTGIYWVTAAALLGSRFFSDKTLIQKIMENDISLPCNIWQRLNYAWVIFFVCMGIINLYVAYYFNTDSWVNFKLFGGAGLTLLFVIIQSFYLSQHLIAKTGTQEIARDL